MAKPWENPQENGKIIGKPWEKHRKMEKSQESPQENGKIIGHSSNNSSGWWLNPTHLKKIRVKVNWDDDISNISGKNRNYSCSSHHQPVFSGLSRKTGCPLWSLSDLSRVWGLPRKYCTTHSSYIRAMKWNRQPHRCSKHTGGLAGFSQRFHKTMPLSAACFPCFSHICFILPLCVPYVSMFLMFLPYLVGGFNPSEKQQSIGMMTFPIYGKIKTCSSHHQPEIFFHISHMFPKIYHRKATGRASKVSLQLCQINRVGLKIQTLKDLRGATLNGLA